MLPGSGTARGRPSRRLSAAPAFALAAVLAALLAGPVAAQSPDESWLWSNPALVRVEEGELAFTGREYEANTSESVYLSARFNDGWVIMLNLFEVRNVLFRKWGIYVVVTDPAGNSHWAKLDMRDEDVRYDTTRLFVTDGINTIEGGPTSYRVRLDFPGFACDLRLENLLPAWKGGDGLDRISADGRIFAIRVLACPWGEISGTIVLDGRPMAVRGQGLLEKSMSVIPLNRLDPILHALRAYSPDSTPAEERWYIGLLDVTSHESFGSPRFPRLEVARGGEWIFTSAEVDLQVGDLLRGVPYPAPRRLYISAGNSGYHLEAVYRARTLFNVTDVLTEVPKWLRPIVALFVKRPVYFRFLGELEGDLTYPDGRVEHLLLFGPYEYVVAR